jgi:uncharacterized protein DUF4440
LKRSVTIDFPATLTPERSPYRMLTVALPPGPMTDTRKEVLACEERLRLADVSTESDTSGILDQLLADDVLMVGPNGRLVTKAFVLEAHRPPGKSPFESVVMSELEIRDLGAHAVVSCVGEYKVGAKALTLRFFRVWSKTGTGWKVIAGSVTQIV